MSTYPNAKCVCVCLYHMYHISVHSDGALRYFFVSHRRRDKYFFRVTLTNLHITVLVLNMSISNKSFIVHKHEIGFNIINLGEECHSFLSFFSFSFSFLIFINSLSSFRLDFLISVFSL